MATLPLEVHELHEFLEKKEFFCYRKKDFQPIFLQFGAPARVSYHNAPICASHAVGKCVVDIIDSFGLDSDQEEVIKALVEKVQPDNAAHYIQEFNNESIEVNVWIKGFPEERYRVSLKIYVQTEISITSNWTGPPNITPAEMTEHKTRMVAIWKHAVGPHAVYVKRWTKCDDGSYNFDCINSWGEQEPFPQLKKDVIDWIFCISLYK